jgi:hypothetical protein
VWCDNEGILEVCLRVFENGLDLPEASIGAACQHLAYDATVVHGDRLAITRLEMVFGYLRKRLAFLRRVGPSRLVQRTLAAKSVALAYSSASANSPSRPARDRSTAKLMARVDLTAPDRCQNSVTRS